MVAERTGIIITYQCIFDIPANSNICYFTVYYKSAFKVFFKNNSVLNQAYNFFRSPNIVWGGLNREDNHIRCENCRPGQVCDPMWPINLFPRPRHITGVFYSRPNWAAQSWEKLRILLVDGALRHIGYQLTLEAELFLLIASACNFNPSAPITFRIVSKPGLRSPERAL